MSNPKVVFRMSVEDNIQTVWNCIDGAFPCDRDPSTYHPASLDLAKSILRLWITQRPPDEVINNTPPAWRKIVDELMDEMAWHLLSRYT